MIRLALPATAADNFIRAASRWQEVFKKDVAVVLRQQAKSIITNSQRTGVMDLTPPTAGQGAVGSVSDQRKAGERAVARDISSVFISAKAAVKKAKEDDPRAGRLLSRLLRERHLDAAMAVLRNAGNEINVTVRAHARGDGVGVKSYTQKRTGPRFKSLARINQIRDYPDPPLHARLRNNRGRVNQSLPSVMISDPASLTSYIRKKQAMVGYHKAGWKASASAVGAAVPAFVARHNAPGKVIDNLAQPGPRFGITFINETRSISIHNIALGIAAKALQFAANRIDRAVRGYLQRTQRI